MMVHQYATVVHLFRMFLFHLAAVAVLYVLVIAYEEFSFVLM